MSNTSNTSSIDTRKIVSSVLGVENSAAWEIVSSDPEHHLYMVHHKPEANLADYGQIRGIVVDTEAQTIVCESYGYTPTIVSDSIRPAEEGGMIQLTDELGTVHQVNPDRSIFKIGFEGTLINVFKHDGKVYRSTRKRLNPSKSRWGNSETFMNMYWDLGGPTDNELFNPESDYSPYCHTFIIVHPDVLVVSKDNIGRGYLVYLGPKQMWSLEYSDCPYKQTQEDGSLYEGVTPEEFEADPRPNAGWIDGEIYLPETVTSLTPDGSMNRNPIFAPNDLSLEDANRHLMFGFYNPFTDYDKLDRRMLPGEFVIVHNIDETGATTGMLRVESTSYSWRAGMRDNNPNLLHRFFQLVNGSYIRYDTAEGRRRYDSLYPTFTPYDSQSIKNQLATVGPYIVWPQNTSYHDPSNLMSKESRMYNIWIAFLNSVPLHRQGEVSVYLDTLYKKRGELIRWLRMVENREYLDPVEYSRRVINIVQAARSFARERVERGQDRGRDGRRLSLKQITKANIRNLVMKEEGSSLYRLVREMENWKREADRETEEQETNETETNETETNETNETN